MTLSKTTFSIATLRLKGLYVTLGIIALCHYASCHVLFVLNVITLNVVILTDMAPWIRLSEQDEQDSAKMFLKLRVIGSMLRKFIHEISVCYSWIYNSSYFNELMNKIQIHLFFLTGSSWWDAIGLGQISLF
jgi:hypothetical protein